MFIKNLFDELHKKNIEFCVLRNYSGLPETTHGSDIDICVRPIDKNRIRVIVDALIDDFGGLIVQEIEYSYTTTLGIYFKKTNLRNDSGLVIDFVYDLDWWGAIYLTAENVLSKKESHKNFFIPSFVHQNIINLLKNLLWAKHIKTKFWSDIQKSAKQESLEWENLFFNFFGERFGNLALHYIIDDKKYNLKKLVPYLRWKLFKKNLKVYKFNLLKRFFRHWKYKFANMFYYPGLWIAFIGPDGAGKSSIIENLISDLHKLNVIHQGGITKFHWRSHFLPSFRKIFFGEHSEKAVKGKLAIFVTQKPSSFLGSLVRLTYYSFDYVFGYFFVILNKLRVGGIVLHDRYFFDYLVAPERTKVQLPFPIRKFFYKMIPKPDYVFYLKADPEVIHNRKPELTILELEKQYKNFDKILNQIKNYEIIDTNDEILKSNEIILERIFKFMNIKVANENRI